MGGLKSNHHGIFCSQFTMKGTFMSLRIPNLRESDVNLAVSGFCGPEVAHKPLILPLKKILSETIKQTCFRPVRYKRESVDISFEIRGPLEFSRSTKSSVVYIKQIPEPQLVFAPTFLFVGTGHQSCFRFKKTLTWLF